MCIYLSAYGQVYHFNYTNTSIPELELDPRCTWKKYPRAGFFIWVRDFFYYFYVYFSIACNRWYMNKYLTEDDTFNGDYDHWVTTDPEPESLSFLDLLVQYKLVAPRISPILEKDPKVFRPHADQTVIKEKFSYSRYLFSIISLTSVIGGDVFWMEKYPSIYSLVGGISIITLSSIVLLAFIGIGVTFPHLMKTRSVKCYDPQTNIQLESFSPQSEWQCVPK